VIRNYVHASAVAVLCSGAIAVAQAGQAQQPPPQPTTQPQAAASQPSTTLTGCVYREQDVPGRAPNPAERAGILEDYILAEVTPSQSQSTPSSGTPGATGTSGSATGTSGSAKSSAMYKLELIDDEKLKAVVGKRVEVTGKIDAEPGDKTATANPSTTRTDRAIGRDRIDLPEFEVTSLREVSGTCPAKPSAQ
jgi:hypothetical protein